MTNNIWHTLNPERIKPDDFIALIEIPKGSKNKYELDKDTGLIILDRVLHTSTHYPANYGLIPRTYADDYDPLDVLVLCTESIAPLTLVNCRPIGILKMTDQGQIDEKVIAVCVDDPFYNTYNDIDELPGHMFAEIRHFYEVYKMLENKHTSVKEIESNKSAERVIEMCMKRYDFEYGNR